VKLSLPTAESAFYKSASQKARVATEAWAAANLYCPQCASDSLNPTVSNTPAVDFDCPRCSSSFQLKGQSKPFRDKILDAAYSEMIRAIRDDRTPNLFVLQYSSAAWVVRELLLVPRFAFSIAAIEKRPPLSAHARRAGWIGCNILLRAIPKSARILVIENGIPASPKKVRDQYRRLKPLAEMKSTVRGWTLDVLRIVQSFGDREFGLMEVYAFERELSQLHPDNRHIRDKIRQQLQILRDLKFVEFLGGGRYRAV
jgi:type II restriction enzyme